MGSALLAVLVVGVIGMRWLGSEGRIGSDRGAPVKVDDRDRDREERLAALGYVEHVVDDPDPEQRGVTLRDERADPGVNYFCTGASVRFLDMAGQIVHEMTLDVGALDTSGCLAKPYRPGLMAVVRSPVLSLSGLNSDDRWYREGAFHHDVGIDGRGRLYTFARHDDVLRRGERALPVLSQVIAILDGRGRLESTIDLLPLFGPFVADERLNTIAKLAGQGDSRTRKQRVRTSDIFHPNSIEIVAWPHGGDTSGRFALLAFRDLDRVAVVDLEREQLVWEWGSGALIGPHDPWLLENGNVMVFDNGARPIDAPPRAYSRVVEVDPRTGQIVWQYPQTPAAHFFSPSRGGAQPLPNGNVLITESTKGHVFEVTRAGEVVWDFWNPDFRSEDGLRKTIYRMRRMSLESYRELTRSR